ncbi:MAG: 23S rRNA (pseudouridine(1915)-N(3))-methyltransferase RlmH [Clostridia bacterium]|nr:23S rRNA (pseudouridine(1915)-N(3))-methyltransferase RlmH [Clostridia bacterium]
MLNIQLLCIGKLKEDYLRMAAAEYQKRLGAFCRLTVTELPPARLPDAPNPAQIDAALEDEGRRILAQLPPRAEVIALCIEGKLLSSEALSERLQTLAVGGVSDVAFVIGGSYGLAPAVKQRARLRLSMSPMTFPHQLARVMLLEQIYRAFMIAGGGKYHK